mmetsp:Transcript_7/g.16  ORF Transcript_7/g.16 Transcript_7/m.16 type:complete len:283 (-) Transcript_7:2-850(-)
MCIQVFTNELSKLIKMSCGLNANTLAMVQEMQMKQGSSSSVSNHENDRQKREQLEKLVASKVRAREEAKNVTDWTRTYASWSSWAEEEELREKIKVLKKKEEDSEHRQHAGGCNHDHSAERALVDKTTEQKLKECAEFRDQGNAWFQEGQYFRASEKYRKVQIWLDYTFANDDDEQKKMDDILLPALVNLGICQIKLKQYSEAVNTCRLALQIDDSVVKAYYCRAKAYRCMDEFDKADDCIADALRIEPNNPEIRREYALLQNKKKRYKELSTERAQAMFVK